MSQTTTTGSSKRAVGGKTALDVAIVDGSGNQVTTFGGSGGTSAADRDAFTAGSSQGTPIMGVYEAAPTAIADGKEGLIGITAARELKVSVTSGGTSGTQYTEGDTDSTITGTALMLEDVANTLVAAPGNVANGLDVDVTRSALPTGASSAANQATEIASLQLIDDPVATIGATPVMRVAIFDAADTQITSFGGGTAYTEDAAAAANPVGSMLIARRRDTPAGEVSTDGDNIALNANNNGELYVAGTALSDINNQTAYTALAFPSDDAAWTPSTADSAVGLIGGFFDDVAPDSVDEGDAGALRMSGNRNLYVRIRDNAGNERGLNVDASGFIGVTDGAGSLTVDNGGTFAVQATLAAGAAAIAKAEDVASANADVGVPAMAVQKATPANTAGTDGDYEFLQMSEGRLWTSATIDAALPAGANAIGKLTANSGVIIGDVNVVSNIPGTGATALGKAEDGAHTTGDVGVMALSVRQNTAASTSGTDGDYQPLITDTNGRLHVLDANSAAALTSLQLIDDVVFAEDAGHTTGDKGIMALSVRKDTAAATAGTDVDYQPLITDANGRLHVIASSGVAGDTAHDAVDAGNSVKIGGRADTTFQTAVADADRVDALFDVYGQIRTRSDHANSWSYHEDSSSALTDTAVKAAPGAGLSVYVTDIVVSLGAATALNVFFEEGAATKVLGPYYLEAVNGRGLIISFKTPKKITANTDFTVTTSAAAAHSIDVTGFVAP